MKQYTIKDLEQLSGVKAHTIRIWEKRYNLLEPDRTETNIRTYDNEQLKKLLNVATLIHYGWKISKISELSEQELQHETEKWLSEYKDSNYQAQLNALVQSMLDYNELGFERIFAASVLRIGLKETMVKVVYPFLYKVGMMWRVDRMMPAQEHFASNLIRRKLCAAIDGMSVPQEPKGSYLLFLPEEENHEIGLLLANYLIRHAGYRVIYLGENVPFENVKETSELTNPDYLLSFFITPRPKSEIQEYLDKLAEEFPNRQILLSARETYFKGVTLPHNVVHLKSINSLDSFL